MSGFYSSEKCVNKNHCTHVVDRESLVTLVCLFASINSCCSDDSVLAWLPCKNWCLSKQRCAVILDCCIVCVSGIWRWASVTLISIIRGSLPHCDCTLYVYACWSVCMMSRMINHVSAYTTVVLHNSVKIWFSNKPCHIRRHCFNVLMLSQCSMIMFDCTSDRQRFTKKLLTNSLTIFLVKPQV